MSYRKYSHLFLWDFGKDHLMVKNKMDNVALNERLIACPPKSKPRSFKLSPSIRIIRGVCTYFILQGISFIFKMLTSLVKQAFEEYTSKALL